MPVDDGAAAHLTGLEVPALTLDSSAGPVDLAELGAGRAVLYVYPRTGHHDRVISDEWNAIPGARGCTPQSCGFRDHVADLARHGARVAGLSVQALDEQQELADRLHIAYPVIADPEHRLGAVLYIYPRTGRPDREPKDEWNAIPGARGCTPQSCGFRDHVADLAERGVSVAGLSVQPLGEQQELAERLHIAYPVIADPDGRLGAALSLPTFEF